MAHVTRMIKALRIWSAKMRPVRTADLAMGNERKRSIKPRCKSFATPTPTEAEPNTMIVQKHLPSGN